MAYTKTTWINGSTPAINANNLNKIEDELVTLDTNSTLLQDDMNVVKARKIPVAEELLVEPITNTTSNALTKAITDFDYVEIFYIALTNESEDMYSSVKLKVNSSASGVQQTVLPIGWWYSASPIQEGIQFQGIKIDGQNISYGYKNRILVTVGQSTTYNTQHILVTITSVLGIKYEDIVPSGE